MNAIEILEKTLIEYPKNPTTGELIERRYRHDPPCMCLLGAVGYSGGIAPMALDYDALADGNGIDEAIWYLALAIDPIEATFRAQMAPVGPGVERGRRCYSIVYGFNDCTLAIQSRVSPRTFTPESVALVTEKIEEALDLARKDHQHDDAS